MNRCFWVKVFRLFRLERIVFGVQSVNTVGRCTTSFIYWQGQRVCDALLFKLHYSKYIHPYSLPELRRGYPEMPTTHFWRKTHQQKANWQTLNNRLQNFASVNAVPSSCRVFAWWKHMYVLFRKRSKNNDLHVLLLLLQAALNWWPSLQSTEHQNQKPSFKVLLVRIVLVSCVCVCFFLSGIRVVREVMPCWVWVARLIWCFIASWLFIRKVMKFY